MRILITAAMLIACGTTETKTTTTEVEEVETTEATTETPIDVVDEEAKRLKREAAEFNAEGETFTTEDDNVDGFEENSE